MTPPEQPRTKEAVILLLADKDLVSAAARLESLGRCPAARSLAEQAQLSVQVAYANEQRGGA